MGLLDVQDVTHWSIAVNNLEESEEFYGEFLGLELVGRLGNSRMTCFKVAEHRILLAERKTRKMCQASQRNRYIIRLPSAPRRSSRHASCSLNTRCQ